jgi:tetratricopeptide (TPR) repeat protein
MVETTNLTGKEVALTGRLFSMTRASAVERIQQAGGIYVREPGPATSILVAGEASGHLTSTGAISRNMELFRELKNRGVSIELVEESEFLKLLGGEVESEDFSRLYTAEQVSRIVEAPLPLVRAWIRKGLLRPSRLAHRLAWFDFKDILIARNLSRLTSSGVPAAKIHRSLSQIARWLPNGERIIDRLEAYALGLRVRLSDGSWAEPTGQRLMEFHEGTTLGPARVSTFSVDRLGTTAGGEAAEPNAETWFLRAVEAEEQGDLQNAAEMYSLALLAAPEAETLFNLGNVLYELGSEGGAAERYLQAIDADHNFAEAWNNLGNSLVALGKLEDAVHAYEMALSLEPDYPDPHCNLATVLERLEKYDRALAHRAVCQRAYPSPAHLTLLRQPPLDEAED